MCTKWVYEDPHSFVAEFQLACQEWKRTLVGSIHNFGYGAGLLVIGPLSDRFGRKSLIIMTIAVGALAGTAKSFAKNYWLFIILEFLEAAFGDVASPSYILMIEMVAHQKRVLTSVLCDLGSGVGHGIIPLIAWLVPYWRHYVLILYAPTILLLIYIFLLDESPRWLLSKGRKDKAVAIIDNIAKRTKVKLEANIFDHIIQEEDKHVTLKATLKDTFTSKILFKRFFVCLVWWTSATFVSYGISINSVLLPGNKYVNYGFMSVIDFPANLLSFFILTKFRRKIALISTFFIAAVFCFVQPFAPNNMPWLSILLLLAAKIMAVTFFAIIYIFTSEIFPTYTRNSMHALCSGLGRVGSTLAPHTPLLKSYWTGLPSLIFGLVSLIAGLVTLLAPDTADEVLPDTVQEAQTIGRKQSTS